MGIWRRTGRGWTKARAVMALGSVVGIGGVATLAAFSDSSAFTAQFSTGSVDIDVNEAEGNPTAYDFGVWDSLDMTPGTSKYALLAVNNNGSLPFTYTMAAPTFADTDAAASVPLRTGLNAGVAVIAAGAECNATTFAAGTVLAADTTPLSSLAIGTARPLAAGTDENLCFKVELPTGADATLMGLEVNPIFTLTALPQS